jgi:predicted Zn-dependent protease
MKRSAVAVALLLAGCASAPPPAPQAPSFNAAAIVAGVRAAGNAVATEVEVQPLQDPLVADLRHQAQRDEQAGRLADAASALDRALAERPQDPTLLQERAEIALLQRDVDAAAEFARRAQAAGPSVGPLCRRSLEMQVQVEGLREAAGDAGTGQRVMALASQRDACTLKPPPRY